MQAKLFTFTLAGNTEKLTSHSRESSDLFFLFFFLMTELHSSLFWDNCCRHKYLKFSKQGALTIKNFKVGKSQ